MTTKAATLYHDAPLSTMSSSGRGNLLAAVVQEHDRRHSDDRIRFIKGEFGTTVNGKKRGLCSSLQDYCRVYPDGTMVRVEVKSAQLTHHNCSSAWRFEFTAVKLQLFDELRLVMYTPWGLEILIWDGKTGLGTSGKVTESRGYRIAFWRPSKLDGHLAVNAILDHKIGKCQRVGRISWKDYTCSGEAR